MISKYNLGYIVKQCVLVACQCSYHESLSKCLQPFFEFIVHECLCHRFIRRCNTPFWRSSYFSTLLFIFQGKPFPILDSHLSYDYERHDKSLGSEGSFPGIKLLLIVGTKVNYLMSVPQFSCL